MRSSRAPPSLSHPPEYAGALRRIQVVHAFDIFQMLGVLQDLRGSVAQQRPVGSWHLFPLNPKVSSSSGTVKVVVVNLVTAVVSPLLGGQQREGLALRMQLARELKTLARDLGVAVVVRKWARPPLLVLSLTPANRFPGDGRHWGLGGVHRRAHYQEIRHGCAVDGETRGIKDPGLPSTVMPTAHVTQHSDCSRSSWAGQKRHQFPLPLSVGM
ncbi:hypothetical protein MC885_009785 [Smutsia gigantea]|nr:hypothetical protein MC885_009785 [Smutsia gigantea]